MNEKGRSEASIFQRSSVDENKVRRPYIDKAEPDLDYISKDGKILFGIKRVYSRGK